MTRRTVRSGPITAGPVTADPATADPATAGSVAWIESPFQLLSVIEGAAAGNLPTPVTVLVRGSAGTARPLGDLLDQHPVDGVTITPAPTLRRAVRMVRRAGTLVVGDVFSGQLQALLVAAAPRSVVIVDDGSSTLAAIEQIASNHRLVRPRVQQRRRRAALARLALVVLRRASARHRLSVSSGLPVHRLPGIAGVLVNRHDFSWTRCVDLPWSLPTSRRIILGSAMAADGLIDPDAYHSWLRREVDAATAAGEPAVFFAHRRESAEIRAFVRSLGATVATAAGLPIELVARHLGSGTRFVTLPSTTVLTLCAVAPHVEVACTPVDESWWAADAPASMRTLADSIAGPRAIADPCTRAYTSRVATALTGPPHFAA